MFSKSFEIIFQKVILEKAIVKMLKEIMIDEKEVS